MIGYNVDIAAAASGEKVMSERRWCLSEFYNLIYDLLCRNCTRAQLQLIVKFIFPWLSAHLTSYAHVPL